MSSRRTHEVTVGDITITYDSAGEAGPRPLVLVHGFTGARTDFTFVLDDLARHRPVLAPDQRGHRDTSNPDDPASYSFDQLVSDLAGFVDAVADGPVDLLGHSMGGMVAMRFALTHPDQVASLILMDTAPGSPEMPFDYSDELIEAAFAIVREQGLEAAQAFLADVDSPERALLVEANGAEWADRDQAERYATLDPNVVIEFGPVVLRHESVLDQLAQVRVPTTIIVGSEDTAFVGPSKQMHDVIADAHLVIIDGAYHSPQHTHRHQWLAAVEGHLDRC